MLEAEGLPCCFVTERTSLQRFVQWHMMRGIYAQVSDWWSYRHQEEKANSDKISTRFLPVIAELCSAGVGAAVDAESEGTPLLARLIEIFEDAWVPEIAPLSQAIALCPVTAWTPKLLARASRIVAGFFKEPSNDGLHYSILSEVGFCVFN